MQKTEEEFRWQRQRWIGWAAVVMAGLPFVVSMLKAGYFYTQLRFPGVQLPVFAREIYTWPSFPRAVWDWVPPRNPEVADSSNVWILVLLGAVLWGADRTRRASERLREYDELRREELREARRRNIRSA